MNCSAGSQPSILSLPGSLPVYSHMIRLTAVYSLTARLSACLFSHDQALCLSILALSGLLPTYSHQLAYCLSIPSLSLAAYLFSCAHSNSLPVYFHTSRLTAYLFSLHQARCLCISHTIRLATIYSHSIRLATIYSHSVRLTLYLFSHSCYGLSVLTPNAIKAFLHARSPLYSCTLGLTAYLFLYSN